MPEISREQLIERIAEEVLRVLGENPSEPEADRSGLPEALVIGSAELLPETVSSRYNIRGQDAYTCPEDIARFEKVYITELSILELSDIALGRNTRPVQCAVISALLCGTDICLMESALPHRKHAVRASRGFYEMLEGYVRTLQHFGISLVAARNQADKCAAHSPHSADLPGGVITEALAKKIIAESGESTLRFQRGSVLTPSAKDVFTYAGRTVKIT